MKAKEKTKVQMSDHSDVDYIYKKQIILSTAVLSFGTLLLLHHCPALFGLSLHICILEHKKSLVL